MLLLAQLVIGSYSFANTLNSEVEIRRKKDTFEFKVIPKDGLAINLEGPWKLEIKTSPEADIMHTKFERPSLDEKLPGFVVPLKPGNHAKKGNITFKLIAFVCTKDKTRCYRDVHDKTLSWQEYHEKR